MATTPLKMVQTALKHVGGTTVTICVTLPCVWLDNKDTVEFYMFRYQGNPLTKGVGWEFVNGGYELYASAASYNGRTVLV